MGSGVGNTKTCRLSHCYSYRLLSTVAQHHIRRHEGHWPAHAEACDFYRDPDEQRVITASYAVPIEREWRLSRPLVGEALQPQLRVQRLSCHVARPRLARLLLHLMTEAGLQRICEDGAVPDFPGQVQALWTAAGSVNLDVEAPLRHFLCTSVARMPVLIERLERVRPGRFVHNRPHGILIVRLAGIAEGELFPLAGDPIAVRGRVAVFGENPERCRASSLRPPYLAACVVARAAADAAVEVQSAYVHPCASRGHMLLLDSDYERQTLTQLRSVQSWLRRRCGVLTTIDKPLFDLRPPASTDDAPRPPLIPDFLVGVVGPGGVRRNVVVETMGWSEPLYRERKERLHAEMAQVCGPVLMHDFHQPADADQAWRDNVFWRALRDALLAG